MPFEWREPPEGSDILSLELTQEQIELMGGIILAFGKTPSSPGGGDLYEKLVQWWQEATGRKIVDAKELKK